MVKHDSKAIDNLCLYEKPIDELAKNKIRFLIGLGCDVIV